MTRTMEGYTWKGWSKHFCKSWSNGNNVGLDHTRRVHLPEVYTSRKQMGKYGKDAVKIKVTIEEYKKGKGEI